MDEEQFDFFRRLVETTGPSGYEEQTQRVWRERVASVAAGIRTDSLGNCLATLNSGGSPRVLLDAHVDEIGFIVMYIDDDGFLYFQGIGGFDPTTLPGNRVRIVGPSGLIVGVIGRKPAHLIKDEERKQAPEIKNMWIDIGAGSREEAERLVSIGDAGGRLHPMQRLRGDIVTSAAMDDRVGGYIVAEVFRQLASTYGLSCAVIAASSVQEEIGLRGARASAYASEAEIGVAVEVTWTSDHPQVSKTELGDIKLGKGPVLTRGANINPRIFERLVDAARAEGVPYQLEAEAGGTGTDANVMQMTRAGMACGLISVPTRYLHTASETLSTDDVDGAVALLARFVRDLGPDVDVTP